LNVKKSARQEACSLLQGQGKGDVLNKTNANTIGDAYGDDTDDWFDQPLILFSIRTEYQGKPVDGLRCRVPTPKDNRQIAPKADPISSGPHRSDAALADDEIPF
jgi:hypothetical protein